MPLATSTLIARPVPLPLSKDEIGYHKVRRITEAGKEGLTLHMRMEE